MSLTRERYMELQMNMDAKLTPEDHAVSGGFLHFCDEWDGMLIDKDAPEFDCCSCTFSDDFDPQTGMLRTKAATSDERT